MFLLTDVHVHLPPSRSSSPSPSRFRRHLLHLGPEVDRGPKLCVLKQESLASLGPNHKVAGAEPVVAQHLKGIFFLKKYSLGNGCVSSPGGAPPSGTRMASAPPPSACTCGRSRCRRRRSRCGSWGGRTPEIERKNGAKVL